MGLAIEAIKERGTEALSLRALAREAGVSATAPYRHFPSKRCLLADIATQGFENLTHSMRATLELNPVIEQRFIAMGVAYVDFAVANPVHYQLMFGAVIADFSEYARLNDAAQASYALLLKELTVIIEDRKLDVTPLELGGAEWSGVHGIASLITNGSNRPLDPQSAPDQSIKLLQEHTERSMQIMFAHLLAPWGQTPGSEPFCSGVSIW